jgi:hypothetical protein
LEGFLLGFAEGFSLRFSKGYSLGSLERVSLRFLKRFSLNYRKGLSLCEGYLLGFSKRILPWVHGRISTQVDKQSLTQFFRRVSLGYLKGF